MFVRAFLCMHFFKEKEEKVGEPIIVSRDVGEIEALSLIGNDLRFRFSGHNSHIKKRTARHVYCQKRLSSNSMSVFLFSISEHGLVTLFYVR